MPTSPRPEQIRTPGSSIDDTRDPSDHDAQALTLADTVDFICSQMAILTGEALWEDPPAATMQALADALDLVPRDIVLTRDSQDRIETVTKGSDPTWTITYDVQGRVDYLENGTYRKTVNYDSSGLVSGVTVTVI